MNAFWYALADFFELTFKGMTWLGMNFNILLMVIGFGFTVYWIWEMYKNPDKPEHKVKAER